MTVDVEDFFQVSAFEKYVPRDSWNSYPGRVEANVEKILEIFNNKNIKATFFVLGWIAEKYPDMARSIVREGHELASHGWDHVRVVNQNRHEFEQDITRTKKLLEDLSGEKIRGYRAASYSINEKNLWAHDVLAESGYVYSSSIVPIKHDLYGMPDAPRFAHKRGSGGLLEVPVSTITLCGRNFPCGGGGWFRLYPYTISRWAISRVNQIDAQSCIFYFHPWEIDADQPRQPGIDPKTRFRHYLNLSRMQDRIERLLEDFRWDRMDNLYL